MNEVSSRLTVFTEHYYDMHREHGAVGLLRTNLKISAAAKKCSYITRSTLTTSKEITIIVFHPANHCQASQYPAGIDS